MKAPRFTQALAEWVALQPRSTEFAVIDAAQRAITDTIACMIAGAADLAVERVRAGLGSWGETGTASVIGSDRTRDASWAALINGTAAHALDYDDVLDPAASHVSAVLVPALLALRQQVAGWLAGETLHGALWQAGLPRHAQPTLAAAAV